MLVRNWREGPRWIRGVIASLLGPVQYQVKLENSALRRCHADHLLAANCPLLEEAEEERQEGDVEIGKRMEAPGEEGRATPVEEEDVMEAPGEDFLLFIIYYLLFIIYYLLFII